MPIFEPFRPYAIAKLLEPTRQELARDGDSADTARVFTQEEKDALREKARHPEPLPVVTPLVHTMLTRMSDLLTHAIEDDDGSPRASTPKVRRTVRRS